MEINTIHTLEFPELQPYRTLRRSAEHIRQGIFVAEGEKVVRRLLESSIEVVSLLLTEGWLDDLHPALRRISDGRVKAWVAPKELLESIVGFHLHQGVMAVGKIPQPISLSEVIQLSSSPRLLVALDGLTNADNVGVIVRNCVAFGVDALVVPKNSSSPYLRRAVRMSMGSVFSLPVVQVHILADACRDLADRFRIRVIAAHPKRDATLVEDANLNGDLCFVLGSEGTGISDEVIAVCSEKISIPISDGTDSLNVATASGILLFETQRRRRRTTEQRGTSIPSALRP